MPLRRPAWQPALVDRLKLTPAIIETVARGCEQIAAMADPIGEISELKRQPERHPGGPHAGAAGRVRA